MIETRVMIALKKLRIFFFGLSVNDEIEMIKQIREVESKIKEKYAEMERIRNVSVPRCDGTYK